MYKRLIARLDIKGPNLVKGIQFEGLRVLGLPEIFARHYYENGIDELIYMDAVASLYGRNSLLEIIQKTAKEIFIPLTVGGGIKTIDDIKSVLRSGADRVCINTAAIQRPELIREASLRFGSSTIVISIEAKKNKAGKYEAYTDYGRDSSGLDAIEWASEAARLGAGEIMITSIDNDGTGNGFDLNLTRKVSESVTIPVIASGGPGTIEHISDGITKGNANAVSVGSMLHYSLAPYLQKEASFSDQGNIEYLKGKTHSGPLNFQTADIATIKRNMTNKGIQCREV